MVALDATLRKFDVDEIVDALTALENHIAVWSFRRG